MEVTLNPDKGVNVNGEIDIHRRLGIIRISETLLCEDNSWPILSSLFSHCIAVQVKPSLYNCGRTTYKVMSKLLPKVDEGCRIPVYTISMLCTNDNDKLEWWLTKEEDT